MAEAATLESIINVNYRLIPWIHFDQLLSRFPFYRPSPWNVLQSSYDFLADAYEEGKDYLGTVIRPIFRGAVEAYNKYYTRAVVGYSGGKYSGALQVIGEVAEDYPAEAHINNGHNGADRRLSFKITPSEGSELEANLQQHGIALGSSILALPINLPKYIWQKLTGKKGDEVVELGNLFRYNQGSMQLEFDQNLIYAFGTLFLGERYEIHRPGEDKVLVRITRRPLRKLLSLGLLNHYKVEIFDESLNNDVFKRALVMMTDTIRNSFRIRHIRPNYQEAPTPERLTRIE